MLEFAKGFLMPENAPIRYAVEDGIEFFARVDPSLEPALVGHRGAARRCRPDTGPAVPVPRLPVAHQPLPPQPGQVEDHRLPRVELARRLGSPTYEAHARLHLADALDGPEREAELRRALELAEPIGMNRVVAVARRALAG